MLSYSSTNFPNLLIFFPNFLHNDLDVARTITSFNRKPPLMCVHPSHWPYGIHILHYTHGIERTGTHDAIHDTFVTIMDAIALTHTKVVVTNVWFCVFNIFLKIKIKIPSGIVLTYFYFQCIGIWTLKVWNWSSEWKIPKYF